MIASGRLGVFPKPLIGMPCARDKSQRHYGLPVFIQNQTYLRALADAGAAPVTIPLHLDEMTLTAIFQRLDGLFLAGGEDIDPAAYGEAQHELLGMVDPERDRVELLLARQALEVGKPLLAVCRGMQVLNVAAGGSLYQDVQVQRAGAAKHDYFPPQYERSLISHQVTIAPDSRLASWFDGIADVNSMHHQAAKVLGWGCRPVAWAPDGVVEAVEVEGHPFGIGVQWHPEELVDDSAHPGNAALFAAFVAHCGQQAAAPIPTSVLSQMNLG